MNTKKGKDLIVNTEQELRTLNTAILNTRKWLRKQHQLLKQISSHREGTERYTGNLLKELITDTKSQQERVAVLLIRGQAFLVQHANVVLEIDLENLVFLWNSYVESLRKFCLSSFHTESKEARECTVKAHCNYAELGSNHLDSEDIVINSQICGQETTNDFSGVRDGGEVSLHCEKKTFVGESNNSLSCESYNSHDSFDSQEFATSGCVTGDLLNAADINVDSAEVILYSDCEDTGGFGSTDSSASDSEAVLLHDFSHSEDDGHSAAGLLEESSGDEDSLVSVIEAGVKASCLPACIEIMDMAGKSVNGADVDVEYASCHPGTGSMKNGCSNPSLSQQFEKDLSGTDSDVCADVASLITFDIPGLKMTGAVGGDIPSEAKRRRMLLDIQPNTSNMSSRSESPLSIDSSRSETPTGTLTRAERQNELWRAIGSIDTFLMDKDIIEACRSTASDLSCEDDDFVGAPNVSFAEFLQQYRELTEWLNQVQKGTQREVTSLSEKYLNQSYHEEMLERSPRREFLNSYSRQLLLRYPHMAEQISARMNRLNSQWSTLEQTTAPKHSRQDTDTMFQDLDCDLKTLRRWLNAIEAKLLPLTINPDWTDTELEERLQRHQALQRDIESHNKIVNAVLKLSDRLKHDSQTSRHERDRESPQLVALNLERRWHGIWLQSLEWQCRLEEAIVRRKGFPGGGFDFSRFTLPVLDESLLNNSPCDFSDQSLIELDDDSLLFIGHRDDFVDSPGTSTDDEYKNFDVNTSHRPAYSASESCLFHIDYADNEARYDSDHYSLSPLYAGEVPRSGGNTPVEPHSPSRFSAFFKPDSPLGKRPFPDFTNGEASPAKRGSQSPSSSSGGVSPVVQVSALDSFINSRGLCINSKRGLIDFLYEDNEHTFLKTQKALLDRSSGDSANISESESKMGDSPPSKNLLADSPEHLGGYVITSSDGEEDPPIMRSGSKTEIKDIGYSSESQSNDEVEVIHHQIDMEYKFPGKCEVASDGPLGDKVTLPSLGVRSDYYRMTLVDIDSTDRTDNGDTTDSGGERVKEDNAEYKAFENRNALESDGIETCPNDSVSDLKIHKHSDVLEESWEMTSMSSSFSFGEFVREKKYVHRDTDKHLLEDGCNGLTTMHQIIEFSESDSAPESKDKKSIRYLIEHAEDLVKPPSPRHSSCPSSPVKQHQTVTSPSKQTQTDSCSTVESSCDASGEDNSECEALKVGSNEGFSTATDDADETLFNSVINLESATESCKHISLTDIMFSPTDTSQIYDSVRLKKQTGGNHQQKGRKDRPWSVVGLEDISASKKFDNLQQIVTASESAIDYLHFHTDTDSFSHFATSYHFSTFPRDSRSGNFRRTFSTSDNSSAAKSAKRKLKYPHTSNSANTAALNLGSHQETPKDLDSTVNIVTPGKTYSPTRHSHPDASLGLSPRKNQRSRHSRRRSSLEKKGSNQASSATASSSTTDNYSSAEAESESETTDEYLTAPLEIPTSECEDVHNISGSMSENSTWDNYQMLYPTASEDPCEDLLPWEPQDDLEFDDDFVLSKQSRSIVADVMTSVGQKPSKLKFTKQGVPCDDSDSDLEDFHHILDQSEFTLRLSDQSLRKKRKNPLGTGLHPNPAKYDEIIVTYETNKRCLESICQHLNSDDVTEQDVRRVQGLMNQWEKLHSLALERHKQAKFFHSVTEVMVAAQAIIREAENCLPYDRFSSAEQLKQTVCFLEEKHGALEQQAKRLEEVKQQLKEFSVQYPTVYVDKCMQELTGLHKLSNTMAKKVSEHAKHLENNQAAWLEFLAGQQELDAFLVTDRERLHKLLCQQEYGVRVTKKDVLKELETLQENLSLYESKLSALQSLWASLTKTSDHSAQQLLLASVADLRNQLCVVSKRCREIYHDMEDDETIPLDQQTDFNKLAVTAAALHEVFKNPKSQKSSMESCPTAPHAGTGITRSCASWLRSLPVQVVALMLVTGLVCALDPDILKRLTNFTLTISPELCYVNGPPTI